MAITTELVGKLGADKFEVKTVTGLDASATASVPAGWKSCWVVYQGTASSNSRAEVFGKVSDLRNVVEKYQNIGGGVELSGAQTASVSGVKRGGSSPISGLLSPHLNLALVALGPARVAPPCAHDSPHCGAPRGQNLNHLAHPRHSTQSVGHVPFS